MSENICSVCGRGFEDKYFDKEQNKCILHCKKEKNTELCKYGLTTKYSNMQTIFSSYLKKIILEHKKTCDYKNGYFLELKNIIFPLHNFNHFEDIKVSFEKCEFVNDLVLSSKSSNYIQFFNCDFYSNFKVSGEQGVYEQDLVIQYCTFHKNENMNVKFNISNNEYTNVVDLRGTTFFKIDLFDTTFKDNIFFNNCNINEKLDLENTFFYKKVNFLNMEILKGVQNRETARIIKDSFEQQNNIIEANKYYALEMKKREEELTKDLKEGRNFFEWLVFKVHGISSNHSQDWLLALFWIISFTFSIGTITNDFEEYHINFINLIPAFFIFIMSLIMASIEIEFKNILLLIFGFISYGLYSIISCDFNLYNVANHINPFSVMNSWDNITFSELIFKVIIAYLIYQLIISIRQNTRRK